MEAHVDIVVEPGVDCPLDEQEVLRICRMVLDEEDVTRDCFVSVTVVGEEQIQDLNAQWRGQDRVTDVISLECERPDDPDLAPGEPCELGDVVLAPAYIARQAQRYATTTADEFRLLLVHGLLHLLGYDHIEESEALAMERREDELVAMLKTDGCLGSVHVTRHQGDDAL